MIHGAQLADTGVVSVAAKQAFVDKLERISSSEKEIISTVIYPTGFFSDVSDFLDVAKSGRIYLFGDGKRLLNPIYSADFAKATADALKKRKDLVCWWSNSVHTYRVGKDST